MKILPSSIVNEISGALTGYTVQPVDVKQTKIYYGSICLKSELAEKINVHMSSISILNKVCKEC